ncbi:mitotic checkpoint serine/threonine-protein kinase BUB1 isoform X2 [Gouania willdenowi]|nr:mitotic checkpoint serine/threonine-protein kinase BUB1 isoform X2 [Gouania willdenowi]
MPSLPASQNKAPVDVVSKLPSVKAFITVSRSETSGLTRSAEASSVQTVPQYDEKALVCEGSELCFEEVRAAKYFKKLREKQEDMKRQMMTDTPSKKIRSIRCVLSELHGHQYGDDIKLAIKPPSHTVCSVETASLNPPPSELPRLHVESSAAPPLPHFQCSDTNEASIMASHRLSVVQSDGATAERWVDATQHPPSSTTEEEDSPSHQDMAQPLETEERLDLSQSVTANLSHVTPNTSLGYVQATPSRVLPSPTVNTREALGVIMDMFQAPTFLEEPFSNTTILHEAQRNEFDAGTGKVSVVTKPPPKASFTIFQDSDKENGSAALPLVSTKPKPVRALSDITTATKADKPNDTPSDLMPDESAVWGACYNSLHLPNSTSDFAMLAHCVSTPCTNKEFFSSKTFQDREINSDAEEGAFVVRPAKKLSPIIEQSPSDEKLSETRVSQLLPSSAQQGTIVGEALLTSSSVTIIQPPPPAALSFRDQTMSQPLATLSFRDQTMSQPPPPAALSFRDQTMSQPPPPAALSFRDQTMTQPPPPAALSFRDQTMSQPLATLSFRDQTMSQPPPPAALSFRDQTMSQPPPPAALSFRDQTMSQPPPPAALSFRDQTMSQPPPPAALSFRDQTMTQPPAALSFRDQTMTQPPAALSFRDQTLCSSESSRPGWEVYASLEPPKAAAINSLGPQSECFTIHEDSDHDVPMSPECPIKVNWMTIRSPEAPVDSDMDAFMSPRASKSLDVSMTTAPPPQTDAEDASMKSPARTGSLQLVSDPWDSELISGLLSALSPPLTAHPCCISWQCRMPNIAPKMTLSMGDRSLRVDSVAGGGAFATVYQVTDPVSSERMVLKVQKPANPWEFYIDTQLDTRLEPDMRHLYTYVRSAHLFLDGSALLCDLHNYGTLLNAVNIYRTLSDKVMPQPLVLYFTVCMLHMVERLHDAGIVHADIKPDNFLLGERFLENKCFDPEISDHGLVLVDFGQSIDMKLFPQCTAFTARCLTSGFQCTEMLSGKPWNYQTDYFGIAGTVHCLLFGTYMQVTNDGGVWTTNGVFRRNPHSELWQHFFHVLLNVSSCSSPIDLRGLRLQLSSVLHQNYSRKLPTLKSRLVVLLLENRRTQHR